MKQTTRSSRERQFKVIIERDEDNFFVASVLSLPGCHTQAKTFHELMGRVKDAIQLCLEVAYGQTITGP